MPNVSVVCGFMQTQRQWLLSGEGQRGCRSPSGVQEAPPWVALPMQQEAANAVVSWLQAGCGTNAEARAE